MDLFPDIFAAKRMVSTGVVTTPNVITGAQYQYGTVGTYVIAFCIGTSVSTVIVQPGELVSGNRLAYFNTTASTLALNTNGLLGVSVGNTVTLGLSGTWRVLTYFANTTGNANMALFVRIA